MQHAKTSTPAEEDIRLGPFKRVDIVLLVTLALLVGVGVYTFASCHDLRVLIPVLLGGVGLVAVWAIARFVRVGDIEFVAHVVFPVVLCALCVGNAIFFTPACVPDEEYHYKKAYTVANLIMRDMEPLEMRNEDVAFNHNPALFNGKVEAPYWNELPNVGLSATHDGHQPNIPKIWSYDASTDLPQFRLPAALGIMAGKAFGLSGYVTFLVGRLLNALYGVALIALAVRLAPVGKNALMAASLLPMCLHLLGSYSYDVGYIGLAFLTVALLLRLFYGSNQVSLKLMAGYVLCSTLLAPGKLVYMVIGLLCVLVPNDRFASKRTALCFKSVAVLLPVATALLPSLTRISVTLEGDATADPNALDHRGPEAGNFYTLGGIVSHPAESIRFLAHTFAVQGRFYFNSLIGGSLGWFQQNIKAPHWLSALFVALLLFGTVRAGDDDQVMSRSLRIGLVVVSAIGTFGVILSMWTGWTFTTDAVIHGVQGRYVLPFVPGMMLAIRPRRLGISWPMGSVIIMTCLSLECLYLSLISQAVILA